MSWRDWKILKELREDFLATVEVAYVFNNEASALLITSDDKVVGMGSNCRGCLGIHPKFESCRTLTEISSMSKKGVKEFIQYGAVDTGVGVLAHLYSGKVYIWGDTFVGNFRLPTEITFPSTIKVKTVACGLNYCAVLSTDGKVFTWGLNNKVQLGHVKNIMPYAYLVEGRGWSVGKGTEIPSQVDDVINGKTVIDISCGRDFMAVVLDNGKVVTWGNNDRGQLGIGKHVTMNSPCEITILGLYYNAVIEKIACGSTHVLALSKSGTLYTWGSNEYFQLGISNKSADVPLPEEVKTNSLRFINISASYLCNLSVAQCENGKIYMWGQTSTGKLSQPTLTELESIDQAFAFFAVPKVMLKPIRPKNTLRKYQCNELPSTLLKTLEEQFDNPDTTDLIIAVENKEIRVHQTILKIRSEYFKVMLTRWLKKDEMVVTIKEKSFAAMEAYLKYLYTDRLNVDMDLGLELLQLADEYDDENFKSHCEKVIRHNLTTENVAKVFPVIRKYNKNQILVKSSHQMSFNSFKNPLRFDQYSPEWIHFFVESYIKPKPESSFTLVKRMCMDSNPVIKRADKMEQFRSYFMNP